MLAAAALIALAWANLDFGSYDQFWHTSLHLEVGSWSLDDSLRHVVNDGLMVLFFFVIGLEIKRELIVGELRDRRAALLPLFAAVGGMVIPALVYLSITRGHAGTHGWGIPMATDIAFAMGVLALLGSRVPAPLKVLLLAIAVIDDIG
ncbi:MAG: Na+/H+ antiporter NhaA, partial [Gemmatimonadaceae bacterium]|nr:Na+/H+ antiporter NhaA [Gemmatimonadaceae bacterium]